MEEYAEPSFEINRTPINLEIGGYVLYNNEKYKLTEIIDFNIVIGLNIDSGRAVSLRVKELLPVPSSDIEQISFDLEDIADNEWQIAQQRYAAIKPILELSYYGRKDVVKRADEVNVNTATLYRWIKRYNTFGNTVALAPKKPGSKKGDWRIENAREVLLSEVIDNYYLTVQRPSIQATVIEVQRVAQIENITPPSPSTIRQRIINLPEKDVLWRRGQKEKAKNKFTPTAGKFPNADFPLAVVQIDHTPADIILVDDIHRLPMSRPYITLAVDVFTRMVVGYYLSFDPPSETSVAMCVAQMILPKEEWLTLHNVDSNWPVWGIPQTIHVDNGADFKSNNFSKSCEAYGINLEFRPVRVPRYGGHVERILGTIAREIHKLPGTTFSSIKERDSYDSDKNSALTKSEFEEWLVNLICKVYHNKTHSSIGMPPIKMWEQSIFGDASTPGIGMQPRFAEQQKLLLDFLPCESRTIQAFGVRINDIFYYSESLRNWINSVDVQTKKKRKFIFRYDPRDISCIWFYDPDLKVYFKIPFADQSLPQMSLWELNMAKTRLKEMGQTTSSTSQILNTLTEMRALVEEASLKTKKARRQSQKRREHKKAITPVSPSKLSESTASSSSTASVENPLGLSSDIDSYTDIS